MDRFGDDSTAVRTCGGPAHVNTDHPPMLVVMHGSLLGMTYALDRQTLTIGRSNQCDIQIDDENVSRNHAELVLRDRIVWLRDLGSTNGTYVNSKKITEVGLDDGDLILIGQIIFKFLLSNEVENHFFGQMYVLATTDFLTGISNRQHLMSRLEQEFNRSIRYRRELSIILYDIDRFKEINYSLGHLAGDQLLMESCRLIRSQIRDQDILGRYGGDEFLAICPETTLDQAVLLSKRIRAAVAQTDFSFKGNSLVFTISSGVAEFSRDLKSPLELIARADTALFKAKQSGRDRIAI